MPIFNKDLPLISASDLFANIKNKNLLILDATKLKAVANAPALFSDGHILDSLKFDFNNAFVDNTKDLPNSMPNAEQFTTSAQALGINKDSIIVIYDARGVYSSPRAWWMFKCMGHENVYVLDGGLQAWMEHDYPISQTLESTHQLGNFQAIFNTDLLYSADEVLESINTKAQKILDARGEQRFYGRVPEPREGLRSGHIPYSINLPFTQLVNNGKFLNKDELRKLFKQRHLEQEQKIISSCGSGLTACIILLAAYSIGYRKLAVYDGSWTEWGMNSKLPISLSD